MFLIILQDLSPIRSTAEDQAAQKIEVLKAKLLAMNPTQREIQLDAITRVIEGSGTVVNIKLPKQAQQTRGRPKGASNKPTSTTTRRDPSHFEHVERKRKASDQKEEQQKKQKKEPEKPKRIQPIRQFPADLPASVSSSVSSSNPPPPPKKFRPIKAVKLSNPPRTLPEIPRLIKKLPSYIKKHVHKALDVDSDGHCGFRAVSYCLKLGKGQDNFMEVRQKLLDELNTRGKWYVDKEIMDQQTLDELKERTEVQSNKPCGKRFWMCMPSMGEPLANAFQSPLFFFSSASSQTFLPHFCPPNNNPPIFLAYSNSHFSVLELKDPLLFPSPILLKTWRQLASPEALKWEEKYASCFELTSQLKGGNKSCFY